jgi:epoxyqueuosine reductase
MLDKEFCEERLTFFDFRIPDDLPKAKSLIVIAVPRPQSQSVFTWNGERHTLIIPPTYVAHEKTRVQLEKFLTEILAPKGYRVALAKLPLKLLAVCSGLGAYGRNNLCYVPGMGSFLQLVALYCDLACQKDSWQKPRMMQSCQDCHVCRQSCPTGAIPSDRFLLRAERCIVFHNERKGDIPFPAWIDRSWHNCLVGCMRCQTVCPENRQFLSWVEERVEFFEEETELLLERAAIERLPAKTKRKLEHLSLLEDADTLPRNLKVFFRKWK